MEREKKDTSWTITRQPCGPVNNEYLDDRLALRDSDPAKYLRETSAALRLTVERYAELKSWRRTTSTRRSRRSLRLWRGARRSLG